MYWLRELVAVPSTSRVISFHQNTAKSLFRERVACFTALHQIIILTVLMHGFGFHLAKATASNTPSLKELLVIRVTLKLEWGNMFCPSAIRAFVIKMWVRT